MKKFKFQVPKGTRPLTREELKHIYGGIITDVNQYNCSDTVPRTDWSLQGETGRQYMHLYLLILQVPEQQNHKTLYWILPEKRDMSRPFL